MGIRAVCYSVHRFRVPPHSDTHPTLQASSTLSASRPLARATRRDLNETPYPASINRFPRTCVPKVAPSFLSALRSHLSFLFLPFDLFVFRSLCSPLVFHFVCLCSSFSHVFFEIYFFVCSSLLFFPSGFDCTSLIYFDCFSLFFLLVSFFILATSARRFYTFSLGFISFCVLYY